ncbi:hypothetical protein EMPS_09776 [Entomortierella parvispora]|uniref:Uncharacterized protein n=1 Tax=Entomortierella parvispora TaxID=205924 RepID=A0A9P3HJG6_9FUNG|nr:hypothetical protein EMPS_09776 [Entomortierella parvispora]
MSPVLATCMILMLVFLATPQGFLIRNAAVTNAAPIPVADNDSNFGGGTSAPNDYGIAAASTCLQDLEVVPALEALVGSTMNYCSNGNVVDHRG